MSKGKKILIVILIAAIFAAVAGYGLYVYLTPLKTTIYVYNNNYDAGKTISGDMLTPIVVDNSIVINGRDAGVNEQFVTAQTINSVISSGDSLLTNVYKGQALTLSDLNVASGTAIEKNMRTDAIAVSINLNNTTGVTSGLRIGSRVNVYSSVDGITSLLLENMRVIKVNKSDGALSSVTIECTQEEALKIIYATEYTSVHLGLVNASEYEPIGSELSYGTYTGK
jgi:Flp pilus assembly protein CpaB